MEIVDHARQESQYVLRHLRLRGQELTAGDEQNRRQPFLEAVEDQALSLQLVECEHDRCLRDFELPGEGSDLEWLRG